MIKSYDIDLTIDMLNHFKIYGFLNKNKLSEKMNHLEKCGYTKFQLAKYARSGYMIDENLHISTFLSRIKLIYAIQTSGINDLKELIMQTYGIKDKDLKEPIKTNNRKEIELIQNIEKHNPDNNNLTKNTEEWMELNTKEWMELFESCIEVLNDVETQKYTYDGYASDNTTNTASTDPLTDSDSDSD